jgi:pilus assembly protein CpaF
MTDTALIQRVTREVADLLSERSVSAGTRMDRDDERSYAHALINAALERETQARLRSGLSPPSDAEDVELAAAVHDRLFGLGRLQPLLDDDDVSDVAVNGCDHVFVTYRDGRRERVRPVADTDAELIELIRLAAARMGRTERRFDAAEPELNLQLPDGSRLHAIRDVSGRPCVSIRRHKFALSYLDELIDRRMLTRDVAEVLRSAVRARKNLVISGSTGAGKTTLLRALVNEIDAAERLVTVEDNLELSLDRFAKLHPDVVTLEARQPNIEGRGGIELEQLVRMGLRMNPDRVMVGEVRGPELVPMLLAMTQGRDGSMCTIHAASARHVFDRALMYGLLPPYALPVEASAHLFASAVDFIVHVSDARSGTDGRRTRTVRTILEVVGADGQTVAANELYNAGASGWTEGPALRSTTRADLLDAGLPATTLARVTR